VTLEELPLRLVPALTRAEVPYHADGFVGSAHGMPRSSRDLHIVIAPTRAQLLELMQEFPGDGYYADEQQALQELANRSQLKSLISPRAGKRISSSLTIRSMAVQRFRVICSSM
jgi:hypothetical protein